MQMMPKLRQVIAKRIKPPTASAMRAIGAIALALVCIDASWAKAGNLELAAPCGSEPDWGLYPEYAPQNVPTGITYKFERHNRLTVNQTPQTPVANISNLELVLARKTTIAGDFIASVAVTRQAIPDVQMGLVVSGPRSASLIDLALKGNDTIASTLWDEKGGHTTDFTDLHATTRLRIRRTGNVLKVSYDGETKTTSFPSSPNDSFYEQPVTIALFFNINPPYDDKNTQSGMFRDFKIWSVDPGDKCPVAGEPARAANPAH